MNKKAIIGSILSTLMYTIMFFAVVVILILFIDNSREENQSINNNNDMSFVENDFFYIERLFINEDNEIELHTINDSIIKNQSEGLLNLNIVYDGKDHKYIIANKINIVYSYKIFNIYNYNKEKKDILYVYKDLLSD